MKFSANLGFLWNDRPLPAAIRAAKAAGFDAVECHWPYDVPPSETRAALEETGLPMLGLNTITGGPGAFGLSALPDRVTDARDAIRQAVDYAVDIGAQSVHVMAGTAEGASARQTFLDNLRFARSICPETITLLIEPLNPHDAPGYFLRTTDQAAGVIAELGLPGIKLMFDCYHVGRTEGDLVTRLRNLMPILGHIQFASVPDRGTPDHGEIDYRCVFSEIASLGWSRPLGAEYRPAGDTDASLDWMKTLSP
ncbi:hydroxypyruvate isomerase family protein [Marivita geojedonensis]|uniref:Isomerase n=1 Tax=Marivita geojedonensis TaxID=1123756 RepID=A0A1X4NHT9_9RHOB|nr:TIM barrel protein [Marivita geojedonensis]OSQ47560.1 isomerase [Marivita geojedonensis]PRY74547.1 hydroxypyruvate isomerase [Marivita geojedonensis]